MKKILVLAITFMVIGLTAVSAQDFAQMEKDLKQVELDMQAGKITPVQAQQQIMAIQQKYMGFSNATIGDPTGMGQQAQQLDMQQQQYQQQYQQQQQMTQQMMQMMQPQQQQEPFPVGKTAGWPSASIFQQNSLPNLWQPAGTTVSYTYDSPDGFLSVYIKNGTQRTIDELVNAIMQGNVGASSPYRGDGYVTIGLNKPARLRAYDGIYVEIRLIDGGVQLYTSGVAG
jgi:hypothetical protein